MLVNFVKSLTGFLIHEHDQMVNLHRVEQVVHTHRFILADGLAKLNPKIRFAFATP